jgi:hypothetical protein
LKSLLKVSCISLTCFWWEGKITLVVYHKYHPKSPVADIVPQSKPVGMVSPTATNKGGRKAIRVFIKLLQIKIGSVGLYPRPQYN